MPRGKSHRRWGTRAWLTGEPPKRDGRERIVCHIALVLELAFFNVGVESARIAIVSTAVSLRLAVDRPAAGATPGLVIAASGGSSNARCRDTRKSKAPSNATLSIPG